MSLDAPAAPGIDLPITRSPFALLGVSSRDTRHRIVEAAEERSLSVDGDICSKARTDLTNPRNRLAAEVAWLPGISPRRAQQLIESLRQNPRTVFEAEGLPPLAHANLMASAVLRLDPALDVEEWASEIMAFSRAVEAISAETVLSDINQDRTVAGFAEVKSPDLVDEALVDRRREYRDCLQRSVERLPPMALARLATELAEEATDFGTEHPPHLIDAFIEAYAVGVHSFLTKEADNIRLLVDRITQAASAGPAAVAPLLERLEKVVRNWDAVAQPVQLVGRAKGTGHDLSHDIAGTVRSLGVLLYNEHSMLEASQRIVGLLQDAFEEVAEVAERVEEDARALEGIARRKAIEDKVKPIHDLCSKALEEIDGDPVGAADAGRRVLERGKPILARLSDEGVSKDEIGELEDFLAVTVTQCAIAHGNAGGKWERSIGLLEEARRLAHDREIVQRIDTNLATARQNHRLFGGLQTIDSAPTLRTINGVGFTIYGRDAFDAASQTYMATYYFVVLFIPIFPICRYRVRDAAGGGYHFLGKAPLRTFDKWHLAVAILGTLFLIAKMQ